MFTIHLIIILTFQKQLTAVTLLLILPVQHTNNTNFNTGTAPFFIAPIDSACMQPTVGRFKDIGRYSTGSRYSVFRKAIRYTVRCPAIERSVNTSCLTGEREWAACSVVGGRTVKEYCTPIIVHSDFDIKW